MRPMRLRARHRGGLAPWPELMDLRREFERLFDQLWRDVWGTVEGGTAELYPPINLSQDADHYYVRAELPGIDPQQLELLVDGRTLTIAGHRDTTAGLEQVSWHRRERPSGAFRRSIALPGDVDQSRVEASYRNGILTVVLPKAEAVRGRRIQVQVG